MNVPHKAFSPELYRPAERLNAGQGYFFLYISCSKRHVVYDQGP